MNFTKEQLAIINSKEHSFKINAVAGSGKTTTLLEYAKMHPTLKSYIWHIINLYKLL